MVSSMYVPITVVGGVANVYKTSLSGGIASGLVSSSTDRTVYITTRDMYGNLAFSSGLRPFSADDDLNDFEITIDLDEGNQFNTAISEIMKLSNCINKNESISSQFLI